MCVLFFCLRGCFCLLYHVVSFIFLGISSAGKEVTLLNAAFFIYNLMIFLLVLSHLVTDQLLALVHSIHISIYMLSLRPLFRIRVQHSHSTFTRTQFRTQTESFLYLEYEKFCFVSEQGTEKEKPNLCRVSHHIPVRKCCCSACNPLDPTLSAPFSHTIAPLSTPWVIVNTIQ